MSISVIFSNDSKRENSTKQLSMNISHNCNFKNGCSMLNPTLLLELYDDAFPDYTAFKIGNRYFNVTNIQSVRNNLFEITGKVDVLATYKQQILASTQYVSYSSISGGEWLADTRIPVLKNAQTSRINSVDASFLRQSLISGHYLLSVLGKTGVDLFAVTRDTINAMIEGLQDWRDDQIVGLGRILDEVTSGDLTEMTKAAAETSIVTGFIGNSYEVAVQCIRSCHWVPFDLPLMSNTPLYLGDYPVKDSNGNTLYGQKVASMVRGDSQSISIPWHYSDYRRAICENVYLYLPFVGMVALNVDEIINDTAITIKWSIVPADGQIAYEVLAGGKVIGTYGGNCKIEIPIGINQKASLGEIATTLFKGLEKTVTAGVRSATSVAPSRKAEGLTESIFSGIDTAYSTIDTAMSSTPTTIGGMGGGAGFLLDRSYKCFTVSHPTVIEPSAMRQTMGIPTMKPLQLSTCIGFCQCTNAHVEISGTSSERDAIDYYLNSGFYIE